MRTMPPSPSPSPVPDPFTIPLAEINEVHHPVYRWALLVLLVIAILIVVLDARRKYHEEFPAPIRERPRQLRPRQRLMGPHQSQPPPPTKQQPTEPISSIVCTYRVEKAAQAGSGSDCAICLEDFEYGDECRIFVSCNHGFHRACIDAWLARDRHCPLCRGSIRGVHSVNIDEV